jgi:type II restriction/modification system DNA methylase subunit YeeA
MLTYAFDLLYSIYEEVGYDPASIPSLILTNNLYGIEIDERAGELAAFALSMKARQKSRRFFSKPTEPQICVLKNVKIEPENLKEYVKHVGIDLFSEDILATLNQFEEADNFGSLIIPATSNAGEVLRALSQKNMEGEMFLSETHEQIMTALTQADYLSQKYHVVVANPPYMGGGNMNGKLSDFAKKQYLNSKSDMCTMFMERNLKMVIKQGNIAMITMQSWMFLSSYEKLREKLIKEATITSMAHLGARAFDSIGGEVVSTTAFVIDNHHLQEKKGSFVRLVDGGSESEKLNSLKEAIKNSDCGWFYRVSADDFQRIPGGSFGYWVSQRLITLFNEPTSGSRCFLREGIHTGKNELFLRFWSELNYKNIGFNCKNFQDIDINYSYVPYNKGGTWRKWYGNNELVIAFNQKARDMMQSIPTHVRPSQSLYFIEGGTWSSLASGKFGIRYFPDGYLFDSKGQVAIGENFQNIITIFNSKVSQVLANLLMPTLDYKCGDVKKLPYLKTSSEQIHNSHHLITNSKSDWDSYETSWDFTSLPLIDASYRGDTLASTYANLRTHWNDMTLEMQRLEEENNRIFIEAYGLEDELTPDVPLKEITLTCNPYYRYGDNKSDSELEELLLADTIKELISYAVGCMFGRYSLDKPGLILANQGETYEDYCRLVPDSTFSADVDNAIPVLDGDWFSDDIVMRFRKFLRVVFGEEKYEENLRFIEKALGKDLRQYFLKDFYNDHVRRYKKRPIYWMFSSPNGSFNVLIYMHRYRPDTASIVLNEYLREYQVKLSSYMESLRRKEGNPDLSKGEKVKALKELDKLRKTQDILATYERDVLFPLANQRIEIDLDDGVKVNYPKFGTALKKVPGLEAKE